MGRIKSTAVKVLAREMLQEHGDKFAANFEKNKIVVGQVREIDSKKIRNILTGYITKVKTKEKNEASS